MRLDVFLKLSRLVSSRTAAKDLTKKGLVKVNKTVGKSARDVSISDEIEISRFSRITTVRVLAIPDKKQVSKQQALLLYELISEKELENGAIFGITSGNV